MKKFVYVGVSAVALMAALAAVPANAADIYRRDAAPSMKDEPVLMGAAWQGLYLGGHAGYAWGDVDVAHKKSCEKEVFDGEFPETIIVDCSVKTGFGTTGFIGGGQIGYNFQRGNIVFGPEIDLGYMGLDGDKTVAGVKYSSEGGLYGDFTGRLGLAFGNTLIYAKGGAAFVDATFSAGAVSVDDTLWGWTVGGGIEQKIAPNLSLKGEYRHFEFDDMKVGSATFSPTVDAVTAGINLHLSRDASPLK